MPPQLLAFIENNRPAAIALAVLLVVAVGASLYFGLGGNSPTGSAKLLDEKKLEFMKGVEPAGKGVAIQALLADHGIRIERETDDGGKATLSFPKGSTEEDRDNALMVLVKSGLVDANMGLEMFDKGDLTASSEDKRIRLIRAQQGELSRLIKRFSVVDDASVVITIPDKSLFKNQQKPLSVSVQVKLVNTEDRLPRDVVRSIINLVVASLQDVSPDHVALTDTNGNVYNSVLNTTGEMQDKLEEQDQYMKQKVATQLDKLMGQNKYVVTVSTYLREVTKETLTQTFDPAASAVASKQSFTENLNSNGTSGSSGGAASSFLPGSMSQMSGGGNSSKGYNRTGTEVAYQTGHQQSLETSMPGVIEDISIAVTVDRDKFANSGLDMEELRTLIANAASPKVRAANVSVLTADFGDANKGVPLSAAQSQPETQDYGWVKWAIGSAGALILLMIMFSLLGNRKDGQLAEEAHREIQELRELTMQQQAQLSATQRQQQQLIEQQSMQQLPAGRPDQAQISQLKKTLEEVKETVAAQSEADEDLDSQIKSWIESS